MTFYDDDVEMAWYEFDNNVVTLSGRSPVTVTPGWGTNNDIQEWFDFLSSCGGRLGLDGGEIRDGYSYGIQVDGTGVTGKIEANGNTVGEWGWTASSGELSIDARSECEINFAELRSFVQWMIHFQYCVQNFGE